MALEQSLECHAVGDGEIRSAARGGVQSAVECRGCRAVETVEAVERCSAVEPLQGARDTVQVL